MIACGALIMGAADGGGAHAICGGIGALREICGGFYDGGALPLRGGA